ncbi:MAG: InlB B-repeat-containing protein, partial [Propionibacteriaceae bacterium]|nr:InlB B-repeat-containing protein [Propionibacteriaceae bacterium]
VTVLSGAGLTPPIGTHFVGWSANQSAADPDPAFAPGAAFTITQAVVLFAVWADDVIVNEFAVSYDANGGTGDMVDPNSPYADGSVATVLANGFTAVAGKQFAGWSTDPNATDPDPAFAPGATLTITGDITLYAVWISIDQYVALYNNNGGTGEVFDPDSPYLLGSLVTVLSGAGLTAPIGMHFVGWSTNPNATDPDPAFTPGSIFTITGPITLYAVWAGDAILNEFAVSYHANGGTGDLVDPDSPYLIGSLVTVLSGAGLTAPVGMHFVGWSTNPNATDPDPAFTPGSTFTITGPITLYAVWANNPGPSVKTGGSVIKNSIGIESRLWAGIPLTLGFLLILLARRRT